jgi:primosomal protein N''
MEDRPVDDTDNRLPRCRAALERLDRSLQHLEAVVAHQSGDLFLADELRAARNAYARLDTVSRQVEQRLDTTIGRLRLYLGD